MSDDDLLTPRTQSTNDPLRRQLLTLTTKRLRRGRWMRRAKTIGIGTICFAAGLAVAFLRPTAVPEVVYVVRELPTQAPKSEEPVTPPVQRVSAPELELEAEKTLAKAESARRFRAAGDRYLKDAGDYRSALRCYRNFLDDADAADLVVRAEDTWLLSSLKRAREQENER